MSTNVTISASNPTIKQAPFSAKAPAKIIFSGEHSVVYGADAIAVAIQKYTCINFTPNHHSQAINTCFTGLETISYPIDELSSLKNKLDHRFSQYIEGQLSVQHILNCPNDLAIYTLTSLIEQLPTQKRSLSGTLFSTSNIPMGAGMGSSASAIASIVVLYEHLLEHALNHEQRFEQVRFCERLQHGKGSAIDASTVTFGGVNHIHQNQHQTTDITLDSHWYWLYTGKPDSSTGQCVSSVREYHGKDRGLWQAFNQVTQQFIQELQHQQSPLASIKENQKLLTKIGVVSETAQQIIELIENSGGVAKVSGAGTVKGDHNGLILAYFPKPIFSDEAIKRLIQHINLQFNDYIQQWERVIMDKQGAILC